MTAKREVSNDLQPGEPGKANATDKERDRVDKPVSGFLGELTGISSDIPEVAQSKSPEENNAENSTPAKQAKTPPSPGPDEEIGSLSAPDLDNIIQEVEEKLDEWERLKSKVIPIRPEVRSYSSADQGQPAPASTPEPSEEEFPSAPVPSAAEEQEWDMLEAFRSRIAHAESLKKPARIFTKNIAISLACVVLAAILGGYFLFLSNGRVQAPETRKSGTVPTNAATAGNELKGALPASKANETISSRRPTGSADIQDQKPRGAESSSKTDAKPSSDSGISKPDVLPGPQPGRPAEPAGGVSSGKAKTQEQPPMQAAAPARTISITPAPSSLGVEPATVAASQPPPNPVIPNTTASASASPSPPSPPRREPSPEPAQPEPLKNAEAKSAPATPESAAKPTATPVPAEVVSMVQPSYPPLARMQKISGTVELEASVNEKGDVVRAKAISGPILLRSAAEEALRKWKFKPASIKGVNIASQVRVSVAFNLK